MKNLLMILAFGGVAACGGTSINMASVGELPSGDDVVSSSGLNATGPVVTSTDDRTFGKILNNVRIGNGANAVTYDSRLDSAAQAHAQDMVNRGYFNHISPEDDDVEDRIILQGYTPSAWGENLAGGQQSEAEALRAWENSSAHNAMLNAQTLEDFGLGVAGTGRNTRWVLVMATER